MEKIRLIAFDHLTLLCQRVFAYKYLTLLNDKLESETMKWPAACNMPALWDKLSYSAPAPAAAALT